MTTRSMAPFGCALALALATPLGNEADARPHYVHKRCIAPVMDGAKTTWVCKANAVCCYDWLLRKGSCPTARCF